MKMSIKDRFERRVAPEPMSGCHLWTGYTNRRGYGQFGVKTRPVYAHRFAYELYVGPIAEGMEVCHRCDTPSCVNPDHLFLGTRLDNMRDCVAKGRQPRGTINGHALLTETDVVQMRTLRASGETLRGLAARFRVSISTVSMTCTGRVWTHAGGPIVPPARQ